MAVKIASIDSLSRSICVLVGGERYEYFIKSPNFEGVVQELRRLIRCGWDNAAVMALTRHSSNVLLLSESKGDTMSQVPQKPSESTHLPDDDHTYTLIAPEASRGLTYQGKRVWHATEQAAAEYAKEIYASNKDASFPLIIVRAVREVKPKPQIELQERSFNAT